jgi:hypothetical protein
MSTRFTLDGGDGLEAELARLCERVLDGVRSLVPASQLEGLVLGGGYGRGEGGVLKTEIAEGPYNDLEFYVFVRGQRWWNEHQHGEPLRELGTRLSAAAGLHVEFKCDSLRRLRHSPVSMFTYDLVARHRLLHGNEDLFQGCAHHLDASKLPLSEATRLLLNRCTGLLLAQELLRETSLTSEKADFIGRNLAKAELALGDAVLTVFGQYHWSCLERHHRLVRLAPSLSGSPLSAIGYQVLHHHQVGVEFKLHPRRLHSTQAEFEQRHSELSGLASQLWLWLENRRLNRCFSSLEDYCSSRANKCPETPAWRNHLLNLRTFGLKGALGRMGGRYPRERLFNTLPLLLGAAEASNASAVPHLQHQLQTSASGWAELVAAYKRIWPGYA